MVVILSTNNIENHIKICIIYIDLKTINIYILCFYKFYLNRCNKYNFLILLADIAINVIRICIIQTYLKKNNYIHNMFL